jgi:hypothetical protein
MVDTNIRNLSLDNSSWDWIFGKTPQFYVLSGSNNYSVVAGAIETKNMQPNTLNNL